MMIASNWLASVPGEFGTTVKYCTTSILGSPNSTAANLAIVIFVMLLSYT